MHGLLTTTGCGHSPHRPQPMGVALFSVNEFVGNLVHIFSAVWACRPEQNLAPTEKRSNTRVSPDFTSETVQKPSPEASSADSDATSGSNRIRRVYTTPDPTSFYLLQLSKSMSPNRCDTGDFNPSQDASPVESDLNDPLSDSRGPPRFASVCSPANRPYEKGQARARPLKLWTTPRFTRVGSQLHTAPARPLHIIF